MSSYVLHPNRTAPAILVGATMGALSVAAWLVGPAMVSQERGAEFLLFATFVTAWVVWVVGLTLVGAPLWVVFERAGRRTPPYALGLGAAATFIASALLLLLMDMGGSSSLDGRDVVINGRRTAYGWSLLLSGAGLMALAGAMVGWTVWRIAYRRQAGS